MFENDLKAVRTKPGEYDRGEKRTTWPVDRGPYVVLLAAGFSLFERSGEEDEYIRWSQNQFVSWSSRWGEPIYVCYLDELTANHARDIGHLCSTRYKVDVEQVRWGPSHKDMFRVQFVLGD